MAEAYRTMTCSGGPMDGWEVEVKPGQVDVYLFGYLLKTLGVIEAASKRFRRDRRGGLASLGEAVVRQVVRAEAEVHTSDETHLYQVAGDRLVFARSLTPEQYRAVTPARREEGGG